jgi:hypothetical protein
MMSFVVRSITVTGTPPVPVWGRRARGGDSAPMGPVRSSPAAPAALAMTNSRRFTAQA